MASVDLNPSYTPYVRGVAAPLRPALEEMMTWPGAPEVVQEASNQDGRLTIELMTSLPITVLKVRQTDGSTKEEETVLKVDLEKKVMSSHPFPLYSVQTKKQSTLSLVRVADLAEHQIRIGNMGIFCRSEKALIQVQQCTRSGLSEGEKVSRAAAMIFLALMNRKYAPLFDWVNSQAGAMTNEQFAITQESVHHQIALKVGRFFDQLMTEGKLSSRAHFFRHMYADFHAHYLDQMLSGRIGRMELDHKKMVENPVTLSSETERLARAQYEELFGQDFRLLAPEKWKLHSQRELEKLRIFAKAHRLYVNGNSEEKVAAEKELKTCIEDAWKAQDHNLLGNMFKLMPLESMLELFPDFDLSKEFRVLNEKPLQSCAAAARLI